ncbi:serine protease [Sulfitobacter alexandrii]|uniref:Serine protease n=1 Tax=Sulfitobacter alexandrii TaxID=1917485 RepID=A0A1J0WHZ0_9RHOB|nr:serine protease [Sulfitobacter alexandrii]APE43917.1 serine protease [Sulfitobacter alexandrii]
MKRIICIILTVTSLVVAPQTVSAQQYQTLLRDFDTNALSRSEKRFIQAALAFQGDYNGLLDGAWGKISQRALEQYSRREFGTPYEEWHLAFLAMSLLDRYETDGWSMRYFPALRLSLLWPEKTVIQDPPTEHFLNFRHYGSSVSISIGRHNNKQTRSLHEFTINSHALSTEPYTVRKTNFAVSSGTKSDGSTLYTRSNFIDGAWSTVMLSADRSDRSVLNAVTASIELGHTPALSIDEGGRLEDAIVKTVAILQDASDDEEQSQSASVGSNATEPQTAPREGSGTGFFVSEEGHVLTNAHVVQGCARLFVDGNAAELLSSSDQFDLAILRTDFEGDAEVAVFSNSPAKLNSDITAVGYPYAGLLSGLNVTRGSVSSLKGLGGDAMTMQVTAPVQSGNSGGPLLGPNGDVVGVVVSKLDAVKATEVFGDVPQNVNFAVRGEIAKLFLAQNGVDPILGYSDEPKSPVELAEEASAFTVFIECK